jgi:hypothetical protein
MAASPPQPQDSDEIRELRRRCEESTRRSRSRRQLDPACGPPGIARGVPNAGVAGAVTAAILIALPLALGGDGRLASPGAHRASGPVGIAAPTRAVAVVRPYRMQDGAPPAAHRPPRRFPRAYGIAAARRYARSRAGLVSFAVVDSRGRSHGLAAGRRYVSASVVKVMLLAAELDQFRAEGRRLDPGTRGLLSEMITYSDNAAADAIYQRVGDAGLFTVARRAHLRDFTVSGYWANAQISARDMASLMDGLDQVLIGPDADFGAGLLTAIVPYQRWGIPAVAPKGWRVRFKGGWRGTDRGQLVHQVARLERGRREAAVAVLTDGEPTMAYGIETVRGIAQRLFSRSRHAL